MTKSDYKDYDSKNGLEVCDFFVRQFTSNLDKGSNVLDLGCGNGRYAYKFAEMGFQVTAIDSRNVSDWKNTESLQFQASSAENMASVLKDKKFDAIWCNLAFPFSDDPNKFIENTALCLKEGGKLFISMFKPADDISLEKTNLFSETDFAQLLDGNNVPLKMAIVHNIPPINKNDPNELNRLPVTCVTCVKQSDRKQNIQDGRLNVQLQQETSLEDARGL